MSSSDVMPSTEDSNISLCIEHTILPSSDITLSTEDSNISLCFDHTILSSSDVMLSTEDSNISSVITKCCVLQISLVYVLHYVQKDF